MQQRWADRTDLTHALFRNTLCFTVQESGQLMGQEGIHFHQHLLLTVEYLCVLKAQQTAQPLSAVIPRQRGGSFKIQTGSRQQTAAAEH